jgi:segregation and condensation protein A
MPASLLHVRLGDFEGPLDLLLELVRRQQKNILDVSLTELADQFLAYVRQAEALDVSLSMEFVEMAATLIRWKSRALLPVDPDLRAKGPDPRSDLIRQLLDHEQARGAAESLRNRLEESQASFGRFVAEAGAQAPAPEEEHFFSLFDLIQRFEDLRREAAKRPTLRFTREQATVAEMIEWLRQQFEAMPGAALAASPLFADQASGPRKMALLLAMLEGARTEFHLVQADPEAEIWLVPR